MKTKSSSSAAATARLIESTSAMAISTPPSPVSSTSTEDTHEMLPQKRPLSFLLGKIKSSKKKQLKPKKETTEHQGGAAPKNMEEETAPMILDGSADDDVPMSSNSSSNNNTQSGASSKPSLQPLTQGQLHPSVTIPSYQDYKYNPKAWSNLCDVIMDYEYRPIEIRMEWPENLYNDDEDMLSTARTIIERTDSWFEDGDTNHSLMRMINLVSSMRLFVGHCRKHLNHIRSYKIKIAGMHGADATRCPLWHSDNVPLRLIQTLEGPGCNYLDEARDTCEFQPNPYLHRVRNPNVQFERKLGLDANPNWKNELVAKSGVPIVQQPTGEPMLVHGKKWSEFSFEGQQRRGAAGNPGVLHRSPLNVPNDQGRILLNLDVVCSREEPKKAPKAATTKPTKPKKKKKFFMDSSGIVRKSGGGCKGGCACPPNACKSK